MHNIYPCLDPKLWVNLCLFFLGKDCQGHSGNRSGETFGGQLRKGSLSSHCFLCHLATQPTARVAGCPREYPRGNSFPLSWIHGCYSWQDSEIANSTNKLAQSLNDFKFQLVSRLSMHGLFNLESRYDLCSEYACGHSLPTKDTLNGTSLAELTSTSCYHVIVTLNKSYRVVTNFRICERL